MKSAYRILMQVCYWLGFLSIIGGLLLRLIPALREATGLWPASAFVFASSLFLCSLTCFAMLKLESK